MAGLGAQELIKTRIDGLGAHRCAVQGIGSLGDLPQCGGDRIHVALGWVFSSRTLSAPNPNPNPFYILDGEMHLLCIRKPRIIIK